LRRVARHRDKLDILVTLVETYEERRWPLKSRRRFDPVDVLLYAIEELGHRQAELADIFTRLRGSGSAPPLTLEMIQKINANWRIPADLSLCSHIGLLQRQPDGRCGTGESMTVAVTTAVRERLDRVRREQGASLANRLLEIGQDCAKRLKERFRSADHDELLYDDRGLPR